MNFLEKKELKRQLKELSKSTLLKIGIDNPVLSEITFLYNNSEHFIANELVEIALVNDCVHILEK